MKLSEGLIGHRQTVEELANAHAAGRLHHALLFNGLKGVGKMYAARCLAQAVMCLSDQADACGHCVSCRKIEEGIHPDLQVVESEGAASQVKIGSIRSVKSNLNKTNNESRSRVTIIDDADSMNMEAQNSLLKVLEEPASDVFFILIAETPESMLETVLSRCQSVYFRPLENRDVGSLLQNSGFSDQEREKLIPLSEGSIGRALLIGRTGVDHLMSQALSLMDEIGSDRMVSDFEIDGRSEHGVLLMDLLAMAYRDALVIKTASAEPRFMPEAESRIRILADRLSFEAIEHGIERVSRARRDLRGSMNLKLTVNSLLTDIGISIV